jgi:hypothetical protein
MVRLGVQEPNAEVGAHDPGVIVGEGRALVGVELGGHAAAAHRFLEGVVKGLGIGVRVIGGIGNKPRVIIDEDAQKGRHRLALGRVQVRPGRKVRHPQVVNKGRFETLGGAAQGLAQLPAPGLGVQLMLAQEAVDGIDGGQLRILLPPAAVEDFDRNGQVSLGLFEDPFLLLRIESARLAFIGARLGLEGGKAALLVVVPLARQGLRPARHRTVPEVLGRRGAPCRSEALSC